MSFVWDRISPLDVKMLLLVLIMLCIRKLNQSQITSYLIDYLANKDPEEMSPESSCKSVT